MIMTQEISKLLYKLALSLYRNELNGSSLLSLAVRFVRLIVTETVLISRFRKQELS